jgi:inhibitor of KinA sporulation pathway (predicted exonuclease)
MKGDGTAIIIMDLEWTSWEGARWRHWSGPGEEMEIVQIGAVRLADTPELDETGAFEMLIRPRINSTLDPYFTALTGITQDQLDRDGVDLKQALDQFVEFIGPATEVVGFGDELSPLAQNCQLYGLPNPLADCRCTDVCHPIREMLDADHFPDSSELPDLLGFTPPGPAHQGLSDSRCVAEALRRLRAVGKF